MVVGMEGVNMATEMSIDMSHLAELADEVRKTRQPRTVGISRDVVAVLKPATRTAARPRQQEPTAEDIALLAGAAGTLPQPLPWEEMRKIAWEDHMAEKFDHS